MMSQAKNMNKKGKENQETPANLYDFFAPHFFDLKVLLQMLIGIGIMILLLAKILYLFDVVILEKFVKYKTLEIVSRGLAYAAGIELGYMLFTPGPDEAIEPLILGLSSALILAISKIEELKLYQATSLIFFILGLGILFIIRRLFINKENNKEKKVGFLTRLLKCLQSL